jgi:phosphoglycolate phosphatase
VTRDARNAVLFDLDGVLVDSRRAIATSINHALSVHGFRRHPAESLARFIGPPLRSAFAELTGDPVESALVAACINAYRERYKNASLVETTQIDGITDVLSGLAKRFTLAVATSKPAAFAEPLLGQLRLRPFFAMVSGPDLTVLTEHKSATIGRVLRTLEPGQAVMVGDRSFDITGAHGQGIPAVGVSWGIGSIEELRSAHADVIIADPVELPAAIDELLIAPGRSTVAA